MQKKTLHNENELIEYLNEVLSIDFNVIVKKTEKGFLLTFEKEKFLISITN